LGFSISLSKCECNLHLYVEDVHSAYSCGDVLAISIVFLLQTVQVQNIKLRHEEYFISSALNVGSYIFNTLLPPFRVIEALSQKYR
jgi:hypothetical protein